MTNEYVHPDNPLTTSENFKAITPPLISSAIETFAFIASPAWACPDDLLMVACEEWSKRMTMMGDEGVTAAVVWELSAMINRLTLSGLALPPFDISVSCADDECKIDHTAQTRLINTLFDAGRLGDHEQVVKAFTVHVHKDDPSEWGDSRVQYVAMLLFHVASRVGDWRSNNVDVLPDLDAEAGS